jgi:hypothetical protein
MLAAPAQRFSAAPACGMSRYSMLTIPPLKNLQFAALKGRAMAADLKRSAWLAFNSCNKMAFPP